MTGQAAPNGEGLTRRALAEALLALGAEAGLIGRFAAVAPQPPDEAAGQAARLKLLKAAATPEARTLLAHELGCTYDELTEWVICCDLRQIAGIDLELAQAMAGVGVLGIHDLWAWTHERRRRKLLCQRLFAQRPALKGRLSPRTLKQYGQQAGQIPAQVLVDTTVIVVVKGAGLQKPDETLGVFVDGFWPTVASLDPTATLAQRHDVLPAGYSSTPYDPKPLNLVTEIRCGERRIWIKEPNWDAASIPDGPLTTLNREWRMATYAFASWIYGLLAEYDTYQRTLPRSRKLAPWRYLAAITWTNWVILLQAGLALSWSFGRHGQPLQLAAMALALVAPALVLAIVPARQTNERKNAYDPEKGNPLQALPGSTNWILVVLLVSFAISPWGYLLWVCVWATLLLAVLRARAIAWPFRETPNTDDLPDKYYSVKGKIDPDTNRPRIFRRDNGLGKRRWFSWRLYASLYRYLIVLGLPITYLGLLLADFLQWTKVLGTIGDILETVLSQVLSSVLGDVVTYAMDPAKANNIRHAVQTDLMFWHDQPCVSSVHVFAHSQGTPITFEALFHYLPESYTRKLKTYVTIGSVLSYYHQTNPILDAIYMTRFPVEPYRAFAPEFKWVNFWNLVDPIAEFYGLDEYALVEKAPEIECDRKGNPKVSLEDNGPAHYYPASPTNIKTPATLQNHSAYWSDLNLVQRPFARRVLGDLLPEEWKPDKRRRLPWHLSHRQAVGAMFFVCLGLWLAPLAWLVLTVFPRAAFSGPLAIDMIRVWESLLLPLQALGAYANTLLNPLRGIGGAVQTWVTTQTPIGNRLDGLWPALERVGQVFAPAAGDETTSAQQFWPSWPARFLAELSLILVTASVYFAGLGLLNVVYTFVGGKIAAAGRKT